MLLSYIHGTTAETLREVRDCEPYLYGTLEQDARFRRQMAKIQAEVFSFKFPLIGSLYYSEESSDFFIGPDLNTGLGPWKTSDEYYADLADWLQERAAGSGMVKVKESSSFLLPELASDLLRVHGEEKEGPFRLVNRDFGAHNILVDNDFNIVGIVDFDGVMAGSLEQAAQYPTLSCMDLDPPGAVITRPLALKRVEITRPLMEGYKQALAEYEVAQTKGTAVVASKLGTNPALMYLSMVRYAGLNSKINGDWYAALERMRDQGSNSG